MDLNVWQYVFFFKQKTAYELRISDWSSDVCSSDLGSGGRGLMLARRGQPGAAVLGFLLLLLGACNDQPSEPEPDDFPAAQRPVAPLGTSALGDEDKRDEVGEAEAVMAYAMVTPGMTVADIGAGEGSYTVRLARK